MAGREKAIGVLGIGRSGAAAVAFLLARGFDVIACDDNPTLAVPKEWAQHANLTLFLGQVPENELAQCGVLLLSPGISLIRPEVQALVARGIPVINDVEWLYRVSQKEEKKPLFVAITGTNGKSTVTSLIGAMMQRAGWIAPCGGNLEPPALAIWQQEAQVYVLELSSFQLESVDQFAPQVSVLLNITPDHLDRYKTVQEYMAAKCRIFAKQGVGDRAVLNADDPKVAALAESLRQQKVGVVLFSNRQVIAGGVYAVDGQLVDHRGKTPTVICRLDAMRLRGRPNHANAAAAAAASLLAGADLSAVAEVLKEFPGLPHRMQWVRRLDGVDYYDDSKGTNVGAVVESLLSFDDKVVLIAGGRDKKGVFEPLRPLLAKRADAVVLIGEATKKMQPIFADVTKVVQAQSMQEAVNIGRALAQPGGVVLLSPACASFDMFRDYNDRGDRFQEAVHGLV